MTRLFLAYGDSNTYGTRPIEDAGPDRRLGPSDRWPGVAAAALGADWALVEEGLPGRTTQFADPVMGPHMEGRLGLAIALESHGPIDVLVLMLGTNDLKAHFGASPERIAGGAEALVAHALGEAMQARHGGFKVLLICPPPILEQGPIVDQFIGGAVKSHALPPLYAAIARRHGTAFLDAGTVIESSPVDGIHYDAPEHLKLGRAVAEILRRI